MVEPVPREFFGAISNYRPGRDAPDDLFKLASNENPYPPLPGVLDAATQALQRLNRYPDAAQSQLYAALSRRFGLPQSNFAIGAGSVAVLFQLLRAMCEPMDHVVYAWRSFEAYPLATRLAEARPIAVPTNPSGEHDLAGMLAEITSLTKVVLVCSPNNPTGPAIGAAELGEFLDAVPPQVLVVLDEAYTEFVRDPAAARGLRFFASYNNVVLLRSFSKAYGLAGLRLGYAIAPDNIAHALRVMTPPFAVTDLAAQAGIASLAAEDALHERVELLVAERDRMMQELRALPVIIPPSQANFFWLPVANRTSHFAAECDRLGISVRAFDGEGVRITIGAPHVNDRLLEVITNFFAA